MDREIIFDDIPLIAEGCRIRPDPGEPGRYFLVKRRLVVGVIRDEKEDGWAAWQTPHDKPSVRLEMNYGSPFLAIAALRRGPEYVDRLIAEHSPREDQQ